MANRLNWLIFGAGAIGTYVGGSLILHGQKVAFLELGPSVPIIRENGLRLNIQGQEHRILHPEVFTDLSSAFDFSSYELCIFALKSFHTQSALRQIQPFINQFPPILSLQNGVENEREIAQCLSFEKVIAGTVTSSVTRRGPGDILLERSRGIGIESSKPLSKTIQEIFSTAGLNAHLYRSANSMKWSKMLTNLLANASSAILNMSPAQILADPALYAIEVAQLREAINVCRAYGIKLIDLPNTPVRLLAWAMEKLSPPLSRLFMSRSAGKGRGNKMPSFHIDLHSGRGITEVDYLNGAVVRYAQRKQQSAPINFALTDTLIKLSQGLTPLDEFKHQPAKYISHIKNNLGHP